MSRLAVLLAGLGLALGLQASAATAEAPLPQPFSGRIERLAGFPSKHVSPRHVDVWLPEGYSPARRYRVVYMQDGQMLFDARTTWNRQAWKVDHALSRLVQAGQVPDALVVGIWNNSPQRYAEYYPEKFLADAPEAVRREYLEKAAHGRLQSDAYLRFLVEELKPAIDRRYRTRPGRADTFVMGSSMGGLISLYALSEYPRVFGGAACLSTHWPAADGAVIDYAEKALPRAGRHRLYFDHGTLGLDAQYEPYQKRMDEVLRTHGYVEGRDWVTRRFEGAGHDEASWKARLDVPLRFLLGK